jgi:hypothetical protein
MKIEDIQKGRKRGEKTTIICARVPLETKKFIMEKKFKDSEWDYCIICKNCGHISEMHEHDDYDGWSCREKGCLCKDFQPKTDSNGNVIYDEEDFPEEEAK